METTQTTAFDNPFPQTAPGARAAIGHVLDNSIPLSIFPLSSDKLCLCICGLPARGKTIVARRMARSYSCVYCNLI
jgi:hypothetical protein